MKKLRTGGSKMDAFLKLYNEIAEELLDRNNSDDDVRRILKQNNYCEHCGEPEDKCSGYKCWIR